jgi:hypothetical protein
MTNWQLSQCASRDFGNRVGFNGSTVVSFAVWRQSGLDH